MKTRLMLIVSSLVMATTALALPPGVEAAHATPTSTAEWVPLESVTKAQLPPRDAEDAGEATVGPSPNDYSGRRGVRWPGRRCTFYARADNVHMSTTVDGDISAHGAWVDTSNNGCPSSATVTVELQALVQFEPSGETEWVTVNEEAASRRSRKRLPNHYPCYSTESTAWQSKVTVKVRISWWLDKKDTAYFGPVSKPCRPAPL